MSKKDPSISFNSFDIVKYLYEKRKILIIVTLAAAILSAIASFFIMPKYRSTAEIFPQHNMSLAKALFQDYGNPNYNTLLSWGNEQIAESFMPVMESNNLKIMMIEKFGLYDHYGIEKSEKASLSLVLLKYDTYVKVKKTKYNSLTVSVTDYDPEFAAKLANTIVQYADSVVRDMYKPTVEKAMKMVNKRYNDQRIHNQKLVDSLRSLSILGINDYTSQAERLHQAYANALLSGNDKQLQSIKKELMKISVLGSQYLSLTSEIDYTSEQTAFLSSKVGEASIEFEEFVPYKFEVSKALPNYFKVAPNRKAIVLATAVSAFLFTLSLLIIFDNVPKILANKS